jgi:transposase-like protein
MVAQRKYPEELREREVKMVLEIRERDGNGHGEIARMGWQLDVHPEALPSWLTQPGNRRGKSGQARRLMTRSGPRSWSGKSANCGGRTRS